MVMGLRVLLGRRRSHDFANALLDRAGEQCCCRADPQECVALPEKGWSVDAGPDFLTGTVCRRFDLFQSRHVPFVVRLPATA